MSGLGCDRKQRRRWSVAHKQQIVEETLVPGVSVAAVARAHGMNANQVFEWRRLHESGQLVERRARRLQPSMPRLLPVSVSEGEPVAYAAEITPGVAAVAVPPGTIHIQFSQAQLRVEGIVDAAMLRVVLECLRG